MAKLWTVLLVVFSFSTTVWASQEDYYPDDMSELLKNGQSESALRDAILRQNRREMDPLGYNKLAKRALFGDVDLHQDERGYFVRDVYCGKIVRTSVGPHKIPNNSVMNTEHTWPQSKGASREPFKGDLHHLFPSDSRANSVRGNYPFGEVRGYPATDNCDSLIGTMIDPETNESGERAFEPSDDHKGNVARAMFYASIVYQKQIGAKEESYLRKWHEQDPVDLDEKLRNDGIEEVQGNRNPFIDYPSLVNRFTNF